MMTEREKINDGLFLRRKDGSLAFGSDAYLLFAYLKKAASADAAELGCGIGAVSLLCAERNKYRHITGFEIQKELADIAKINTAENGFSDKADIIYGDVSEISEKYTGSFGAVFANPHNLKINCGKTNDDISDRICRREIHGSASSFSDAAQKMLCYGGTYTCVYRPDRCGELLYSLRHSGLEPKRMTLVYPTVSHAPCLVLCEAKKGAGEGMFMTRPLIMYSSRENMSIDGYSDDMKYIYGNGDFPEYFKKP